MEANFVLFKVVKIKYRLDIEPCFDRLIFALLGPNKTLIFFVSTQLGCLLIIYFQTFAQPLLSASWEKLEAGRSIWIIIWIPELLLVTCLVGW